MIDDLEPLLTRMEKGIKAVFPDVSRVIVSSGGQCRPPDASLAGVIERMRELKAGELLLDSGNDRLLIVKYDYGDTYAIVYYENDIAPIDISRLIQLIFARRKSLRDVDNAFMPASVIERQIKIWENDIGLIFGKNFAQKLIEGAF